MKIKQILRNQFEQEFKKTIANPRLMLLQERLLEDPVPSFTEQNVKFLNAPFLKKYFLFPALSIAAIVLIIGIFKIMPINKLSSDKANYAFIPKVSAEGILKDMQASISSERLHYTTKEQVPKGGVGQEFVDVINPSAAYAKREVWIDRRTHMSRLDLIDGKGRIRAVNIIKGLPAQSTTYKFFIPGNSASENPPSNVGIFASREDHDGYESLIDAIIKNDYIKLIKEQGLEVDPKYEEVSYQGHPAYKITLKYAKHKPNQATYTEVLTIDKKTQLPYEVLGITKGAVTDNDESQGKTLYSFSTDFGEDVFALNAPKGYTLMQSPKITKFQTTMSGESYENEIKSSENAWKRTRILDVSVSDGQNRIIDTRDGKLPVDYTYKLFMVKKIFQTEEEANQAKDLQYEEIKPRSTDLKQNNYPAQVYTFPEIPNNTFNQRHYVIMKLEVTDKAGRQYEVGQKISLNDLLPAKFLKSE